MIKGLSLDGYVQNAKNWERTERVHTETFFTEVP